MTSQATASREYVGHGYANCMDRRDHIDCHEAGTMRRFYAEALGASTCPGTLRRVGEMMLVFRELDGRVPPTWPGGDMQMHFEVLVPVGELEQQGAAHLLRD
jgi:hypothetical protein